MNVWITPSEWRFEFSASFPALSSDDEETLGTIQRAIDAATEMFPFCADLFSDVERQSGKNKLHRLYGFLTAWYVTVAMSEYSDAEDTEGGLLKSKRIEDVKIEFAKPYGKSDDVFDDLKSNKWGRLALGMINRSSARFRVY